MNRCRHHQRSCASAQACHAMWAVMCCVRRYQKCNLYSIPRSWWISMPPRISDGAKDEEGNSLVSTVVADSRPLDLNYPHPFLQCTLACLSSKFPTYLIFFSCSFVLFYPSRDPKLTTPLKIPHRTFFVALRGFTLSARIPFLIAPTTPMAGVRKKTHQ